VTDTSSVNAFCPGDVAEFYRREVSRLSKRITAQVVLVDKPTAEELWGREEWFMRFAATVEQHYGERRGLDVESLDHRLMMTAAGCPGEAHDLALTAR
jgi:hypothetical protein